MPDCTRITAIKGKNLSEKITNDSDGEKKTNKIHIACKVDKDQDFLVC